MTEGLRPATRVAALATGALFVLLEISWVLGESVVFRGDDLAEAASTAFFMYYSALVILAALIAIPAVVGIHLLQSRAAGGFGVFAAGLLYVGLVLLAGVGWVSTFVVPWIAGISPEMLGPGLGGTLDVGSLLTYSVLGLGLLAFGTSVWLSDVHPAWIGWIFLAAGLAAVVPFLAVGWALLTGAGFLATAWHLGRDPVTNGPVTDDPVTRADESPETAVPEQPAEPE
jgi:hypothetical protein